jgi:hypothetical protein
MPLNTEMSRLLRRGDSDLMEGPKVVTAVTTLGPRDRFVEVEGGTFNVTMPDAGDVVPGEVWCIHKTVASGTFTLVYPGVNDTGNLAPTAQWDNVQSVSNGKNWQPVSSEIT